MVRRWWRVVRVVIEVGVARSGGGGKEELGRSADGRGAGQVGRASAWCGSRGLMSGGCWRQRRGSGVTGRSTGRPADQGGRRVIGRGRM